ncbi:M17 family peptidase N-terminal domain-containing protein [Lutispora sp.]|uniref:M17 family peptidase N-terminal domain-containing protein n=1 Tax=Lutispora sp. TaxID=2828727 RepID=UPI002B1EFD29|nr:M17 family peptidase N-terminal domain-containing protein [Lutispora sp.]MEA4964184.1 M17 family peptidase N-terminal domain-containing protein [Lutispora sp.]
MKANNRSVFITFSKAFTTCKDLKGKTIRVILDNAEAFTNNYEVVEKACEAALLTNYEFNDYKSDVKVRKKKK